MGGSYKDIAVFLETLGYYYTGIAQAITTSGVYAGMHIAKFGSPELKQEIVPQIIQGKVKLALGMSGAWYRLGRCGDQDLGQTRGRRIRH